MWLIDELAERRIREAQGRGEFDDLEGAGRPLPAEDECALVPETLRVAYRILKNAGCLPPEVQARREIHHVSELLRHGADPGERRAAGRRLQMLLRRLDLAGGGRSPVLEQAYYQRLLQRLDPGG
ncbi:MAG TPA: DnaJ family domain-containing protein [Gammaproteobacteria bacterium]|nr:DnaJ family domain-containing protein [Gammaproteobacteria bacterium]